MSTVSTIMFMPEPPVGYVYTGEFRKPEIDEYFAEWYSVYSVVPEKYDMWEWDGCPKHILRAK